MEAPGIYVGKKVQLICQEAILHKITTHTYTPQIIFNKIIGSDFSSN